MCVFVHTEQILALADFQTELMKMLCFFECAPRLKPNAPIKEKLQICTL